MSPELRRSAARLFIGAFAIVAVFFAFQRERFGEVWKPLLLYSALAVPAFIVLSRLRRRAPGSGPSSGARVGGAPGDGGSVDGAGVDGASVDGAGVDGAGVDGASVDGASVDGAGVDGAGVDGAGVDGAGVDGASNERRPSRA